MHVADLFTVNQRGYHLAEKVEIVIKACETQIYAYQYSFFTPVQSVKQCVTMKGAENPRFNQIPAKRVLKQLRGGRTDLPNRSHDAPALLLVGFYQLCIDYTFEVSSSSFCFFISYFLPNIN